MRVLSQFENLRSLTLVALNLTEIQGLNSMGRLEALWLNQNGINVISGLGFNVSLRVLDLSCNRIERISGLEACTQLETLLLNENQVESLQGLQSLQHLKRLEVGRNCISTIGSSLSALQELEFLDLSGNNIGSLKQVLCLATLSSLKSLAFNNPHFLENPVCNLSNYQTYLLYHFPGLTALDSFTLTPESKRHSESIFLKKKMYYNMRIKTVKRAAFELKKTVRDISQQRQAALFVALRPLEFALKRTTRELHERALGPQLLPEVYRFGASDSTTNPLNKEDPATLQRALTGKSLALTALLESEYNSLTSLESTRHLLTLKIDTKCNEKINRFITELETAGNIRFEEGSPTDRWYQSCTDLIFSRYNSAFSPQKLCITQVTRIHNRFLRNRFEAQIEDFAGEAYKQQIEYLFYGVDAQAPEELGRVMEEGFRSPAEYLQMGLPGCIPLVNSVSTAELSRLSVLERGMNRVFWPSGKILVCKAYVGHIVEDPKKYMSFQSINEIWSAAPVAAPETGWTVLRQCNSHEAFKVWFVFDNTVVIPEYLVEFEYCEDEPGTLQSDSELGGLQLCVNGFITACQEHNEVEAYEGTPLIPERTPLSCINEDVIRSLARNPNMNSIELLDLSVNNVKSISKIGCARKLRHLYVGCNQLTGLQDLVSCAHLTHLDVSYNEIASLEPLSTLRLLVHLNVVHNIVADIRELSHLKPNIELSCLLMVGNPVTINARYRQLIVLTLPALETLDFSTVSAEEKACNSHANLGVTLELARTHSLLGDSSPSGLLSAGEFCVPGLSARGLCGNWAGAVEILQLNHQRLCSLEGIEALPSLRKVSLIGNFLEDISCLQHCEFLEELSLEDNLISSISNVEGLRRLSKLDLGHNFLSHFEGLAPLVSLSQLSIENNLLESLYGVEQLVGLFELYIGNNKLSELKEITLLQHIPRLIILDISGNPMTTEPKYRAYIVFHLKKLKVLDGLSIEEAELDSAIDCFFGRLSAEVLGERLNGSSLSEIRTLDLSSASLRSFEGVFNENAFPWVSELNLCDNLFKDLNCFSLMPRLLKLLLSRNHIETLASPEARGLHALPHLEILDLSCNSIGALGALHTARLSALRVLILAKNSLSKVEFSENLSSLRELDLSANSLKQLDPRSFSSALSLKFLRLDENRLRVLSNFQVLSKLQCLQLVSNRVHEFPEIDKLKGLPMLMELMLNNNPVTKKGLYRTSTIKRIPQLVYLDCQEITSSERDAVESSQDKAYVAPQKVKVTSVHFDSRLGPTALTGVLGVTALNANKLKHLRRK